MSKVFNKIIISISAFIFVPSLTMSVVSCKSVGGSNIWRPAPILPIVKNGFENVNLDSVDVQKIFYTDDLLKEILQCLKLAGYEESDLNIQVLKNGIEADLQNTDIFRNANYDFIITNKKNSNDKITASIKITNSLHLQDVFKVTSIGTIYDHRPRTIMMGLMFNNMDMIKQLPKVGEELTNSKNFVYNKNLDGATIKINDTIPKEKPTGYYGSLELNYDVKEFISPENDTYPMTIKEMVKASNNLDSPKTELGTLPGKDQYTVLMQFIIDNLTNPTYWGLFVNDLDLDNFKAEPIEGQENRYKMKFTLKPYQENDNRPESPEEQNGDYDKKAHYLKDNDGIELTFSYFQ
ncbi:hypothetical protein [Spiroplasma floricola]|uniref:Lipoprotein n=1 Tax=Spiroplasma floricola 23-6 TaxID=1336749 RepID=A0A2K8SF41_9MOLU|nr:hypothetical protein [Spiroplasma floricola]AUB32056.1 hypothetical protein SFLOR_v1c10080 [Spiroplasma floricola 23-6]